MEISDTTRMRLNLMSLMQERKFSPSIRMSTRRHVIGCDINDGNKIVAEITEMIENGATEIEVTKMMIEKYKMVMF